MGDHHHTQVDIDPQELKRAQKTWHGFTNLLKYSVIAVMLILGIMLLTLY